MVRHMLVLDVALVFFASVASAHMTLDHVRYPSSSTVENSKPLRDGGDVWNLAETGSNILKCGGLGNEESVGIEDRLTVTVGEVFTLFGWIHEARGPRVLNFQLMYGTQANFWRKGWFPLGDPLFPSAAEDVSKKGEAWEWRQDLTIPTESGYNHNATIQVAFESQNNTFIQCMDITVVGGKEVPDAQSPEELGPGQAPKYKPPEANFRPMTPGEIGTRSNPNITGDGGGSDGLSPFQIILIILVVLMLVLLCVAFCCYLRGGKEKEVPDPVIEDKVLLMPEASPPAAVESEAVADREVSVPIEAEAPAESSESQEEDEGDVGSKGRHFHFRYIE